MSGAEHPDSLFDVRETVVVLSGADASTSVAGSNLMVEGGWTAW